MKYIFSIILLSFSLSAFSQSADSTVITYNDGRGNFWLKKSNVQPWLIDGFNAIVRNGDTLIRARSNGIFTAEELNIRPNGANMANALKNAVALSFVREIKFSSDSARAFVINDSTINFKGKTAIFENGAFITGTGAVDSLVVKASLYDRIFDTSGLTITNLRSAENVISPMWFCAKGDGKTDDTKAIQTAFNIPHVEVLFPKGRYITSDSLTLNSLSTITMPPGSLIISNTTDRPGIIIGTYYRDSNIDTMRNREYSIRIQRGTYSDWSDTNSIGVKVVNLQYQKVRILQASRFTIGINTVGYNAGTGYVHYDLGIIDNNLIGVKGSIVGTGWNNENQWFGGWFRTVSWLNPGISPYGFYLDAVGSLVSTGASFELGAVPNRRGIPVYIKRGSNNTFTNFRAEGVSDTVGVIEPGSGFQYNVNNYLYAEHDAHGLKLIDNSLNGSNEYRKLNDISVNSARYTTVYEINNVGEYCNYSGTDSTVYIRYPGLFKTRGGQLEPVNSFKGPIIEGGQLRIAYTAEGAAVSTDFIDVSVLKKFVIKHKYDPARSSPDIYIALYDKNGVSLNNTQALLRSVRGATWAGTFGGAWYISNTGTGEVPVTIPDEAKFMRVMFYPKSSATLGLKSFKIVTYDAGTPVLYSKFNPRQAVNTSPSKPTIGSYQKGQIIINSDPKLDSAYGWVCTNPGTFGTLSGVTGTIPIFNRKLVLNSGSGAKIKEGDWLSIGGLPRQVMAVDADTAYILLSAQTALTNATINYAVPTFEIISRIGGAGGTVDLDPVYDSLNNHNARLDSLEKNDTSYFKNIGTGHKIFKADNDTAKFKTLKAGSNITIDSTDTEITINSSGGGGGSYTFSDGLTESSGAVKNDLITGKSGGQTITGGTASGNDLTLRSTTNATKGKINFGNSYYDEQNNVLQLGGVGATTNSINIFRDGAIRFYGSAGDAAHYIYANTSAFTLQASKNFFIGTKGVNYMRMDTLGRILISGNAASRFPLAMLDLDSTSGTYAPFRIAPGKVPSSRPAGVFYVKDTDNHIYYYDGTTEYDLTLGGSGGSGTVNSGAANRLSYYASSGTTISNLAAITANRALISDATGLPTHSSVTNTELGYLSGVTSAIQTQLNGKAATSHTHTSSNITDFISEVRNSISITTTGTSGAATYNPSTGVFNIPQYSGGSSPSYVDGYLIHGTGSGGDTATGLFYDKVNRRFGIGTDTPTHAVTLDKDMSAEGIVMYNTVDQTTNYQRGRISSIPNLLGLNGMVFDLEKGGTGLLGWFAWRIGNVLKFTVDNNSTSFNTNLLFGADNAFSIGRLSASPFRPASIYVGSDLQIGLPANTASTAFLDLSGSTSSKPTIVIRDGTPVTSPSVGAIWRVGNDINLKNGARFYGKLKIDTIPNGTPGADSLLVTNGGEVRKISPSSYAAAIDTGSYIPTIDTTDSNIYTYTIYRAYWERKGDRVRVWGNLSITTLSNSAVQSWFTLSLPSEYPSTFTDNESLSGTGSTLSINEVRPVLVYPFYVATPVTTASFVYTKPTNSPVTFRINYSYDYIIQVGDD